MSEKEELPPTKPSEEELMVLSALTTLDASLRSKARHLGNKPGDGITAALGTIIRRHTGYEV